MRLTELENEFVNRFFHLQRLQWENYAEDAKHDLSMADGDLYSLAGGETGIQGRRGEVLKALIQRIRVDRDPQVARLRNKLDYPANYPKSGRAEAMRPDVLKLMALRNKLALNLGYKSYPDLVFFCEELDCDQVKTSLEEYISVNLPMAKNLCGKYNIRWSTWFTDLNRLGMELQVDALECAQEFLTLLGLRDTLSRISIFVKEQPISGVAMALEVPEDIRILVRPVNSLAQLITLYHEIGHGLGHALNTQTGVFKTWTAIHDETTAIVMERIGLELLSGEQQALARELDVLENVRCAISFLFEMDLNQKPHQAEELYRLRYSALVPDSGDGSQWPLDSFRSLDPVYIHNYVLGGIYADRTISWLKGQLGQNLLAWGSWLRENWLAPGRAVSLQDKLKQIG